MNALPIFTQQLKVINVGLDGFAEDLEAAGVEVVRMDGRPPTGGDARLASLLAGLQDED